MNHDDQDEPLDSDAVIPFSAEVLVAITLVIVSPFWAGFYISRGHYLAGGVGFLVVVGIGYYGYRAYRRGNKADLLAAIFGVLGTYFVASQLAHA